MARGPVDCALRRRARWLAHLGQASAGCDDAVQYLALLEDHECSNVAFPALDTVRAAAEKGNTASMDFLGLHALSHGTREAARSWWTRSAAMDDLIAPLLLAQVDRAEGNVAEAHQSVRGRPLVSAPDFLAG